MGRVQRNRCH